MDNLPDMEKFRLRNFVAGLVSRGDVSIHEEPVSLSEMSAHIEGTPAATLFRNAGPEGFEIVAGVLGSRARLAAALGVGERKIGVEIARRLAAPQPVVEVPSRSAPVHQVIKTGDKVDLAQLPFHLQHQLDGGLYISSAIDFCTDAATGKNNVGCRRLMLRDRQTLRSNLTNPSDMKRMFLDSVKRGQPLPVSFAVGSHPLDFVGACFRAPVDEFALLGAVRAAPMPMVRGVTNGVLAPADAEMIIEGHFDERGYTEMEGPYGEFWGYYGPMHIDPVFHVTALTMRNDVLHQTVLHGGRNMPRMECSHMMSAVAEVLVLKTLRDHQISPAAVYAVPSAVLFQQIRVALSGGSKEQAKTVIDALLDLPVTKQVLVFDDDVDIFSEDEVNWALSARLDVRRGIVIKENLQGFYANPFADSAGNIGKIGFDLTTTFNASPPLEVTRPTPPSLVDSNPRLGLRAALQSGPRYFYELMQQTGTDDGREVSLSLHEFFERGDLDRDEHGRWMLKQRSNA